MRGLDLANTPYIGPSRQFGGLHLDGTWVAMADGSVRWATDTIDSKIFEALSTMAGGEKVSVPLIDQTEPWNRGSNGSRNLSGVIIGVLICPNSTRAAPPAPQPTTSIGIAGLGADAPLFPKSDPRAGVFGYDRMTILADIKDGAANTMMLAESGRVIGSWLQGGPATVRGLDPTNVPYIGPGRQFGGLHDCTAVIAMVDGSVKVVSESINRKAFEAMSTIAGGEKISVP